VITDWRLLRLLRAWDVAAVVVTGAGTFAAIVASAGFAATWITAFFFGVAVRRCRDGERRRQALWSPASRR
jgi:hypothetical protein